VRTFEPKGNKFSVGQTGNKKDKYVEAAKGTNLFFGIYLNAEGKRVYETFQMNLVIERQKQGLLPVPEIDNNGNCLLMFLSPNDLVFVAGADEEMKTTDFSNSKQKRRIYKMVSSSGTQVFFIRHDIANPIINKVEFSALNKSERSIEGNMIKDSCIKLKADRLGNICPA